MLAADADAVQVRTIRRIAGFCGAAPLTLPPRRISLVALRLPGKAGVMDAWISRSYTLAAALSMLLLLSLLLGLLLSLLLCMGLLSLL